MIKKREIWFFGIILVFLLIGIVNAEEIASQTEGKLEVALTKNSVSPPGNISFKVLIYNPSIKEDEIRASVLIRDSYGDKVYDKTVKVNEVVVLEIPANASAGYWNVEASSSNLNVKRLFYVSENEQASFEVYNSTLIITNIGNVWYRRAVEISIGETAEIKQMDLDLGESIKLRLLAPDGFYKVAVSDGKTSLTSDGISLTGNVISVEDVRNQANMVARYPIVWLFLITVIGMFIFMTIEGVRKRGFALPVSTRKAIEKIGKAIKPSNINRDMEVRRETRASLMEKSNLADAVRVGERIEAEYSVVMKGSKTESTIISLKLKKAGSDIKSRIRSFLQDLSHKKAAVMETQEFVIIILSPVLTKTFSNEVPGIKIALQLKELLMKSDADFGIGVHVGEIIGGLEQGRLKFTPLGTTLSYAKKISDLAEKEVLLSRDMHTKTMSEVKTRRMDVFGNELYKVESVTDRERYTDFIAKFKNRQAEEAKRAQQQALRDSLNK